MKVLKHKDSNEILHWCTDEHSIVDIRNRSERPNDDTKDWYEVIKPMTEDDKTYYDTEWIGHPKQMTLEERVANAEKKAEASMEAIAELYEQGN